MGDTKSGLMSFGSQAILIFLAALGTLATIVSAWIQLVPGKPVLEASITSIEEFTRTPSLTELSSQFKYKGKEIQRLINIKLSLKNVGNKTIIGKGDKKNIIGDYLSLIFPDEFNVIEARVISDDLNLQLQPQNKRLNLLFTQWRANEAANLSVFLEGLDNVSKPRLLKKEREILDGDVTVVDISEGKKTANPLYNYIDSRYVRALKAFGYLTLAIVFSVFLILVFEIFHERYKTRLWMRDSKIAFDSYVDKELSYLENEEKEELKKFPKKLSEVFWERFGEQKYPATLSEGIKDMFAWAAFFLILALGCLPLFISLHYLY